MDVQRVESGERILLAYGNENIQYIASVYKGDAFQSRS